MGFNSSWSAFRCCGKIQIGPRRKAGLLSLAGRSFPAPLESRSEYIDRELKRSLTACLGSFRSPFGPRFGFLVRPVFRPLQQAKLASNKGCERVLDVSTFLGGKVKHSRDPPRKPERFEFLDRFFGAGSPIRGQAQKAVTPQGSIIVLESFPVAFGTKQLQTEKEVFHFAFLSAVTSP